MIRTFINIIDLYYIINKFIEESMKHLLIAAVIAILIGTMQAIRIKSERPQPDCVYDRAFTECGLRRPG